MSRPAPIVIVPDESELGPQAWCNGCRSFWPVDDEFWGRKLGRRSPRCRACNADACRRLRLRVSA